MTKPTLLAVIVCLLAASLSAQNTTPLPSTPPSPFTGYFGRFLDSASTQTWLYPNRTLRADTIELDRMHDRIYLKAGDGWFGAYQLSTFASRIGTPFATGPHGEQYLSFVMHVNPETDGTWTTINADGSLRLAGFDFDSRGYIYLAYTLFGWGIVDQQGHKIAQVTNSTGDPTPSVILTLASAGHQYVIVSDGTSTGSSVVWDVTTPQTPSRVGALPYAIANDAKNAAGDAIAILRPGSSTLSIFTPDALISNGAPSADIAPSTQDSGATYQYKSVSTDGVNFYAAQDGFNTVTSGYSTVISTIAPSQSGYTSTEMPMSTATLTTALTFESGYLTWLGFISNGTLAASVYRWNGVQFSKYDVSSYVQANYTHVYVQPKSMVPYCVGTDAYALFGFHGLGDVFTLAPAVWSCLPGAPVNPSATAADSSATVSFTPPASDGGSAITSYTVVSNPGAISATGSASPVTVTGLTNGTTYTFTVTATNAIGTGPTSAQSNAATPNATLTAPAFFAATATGTTSVTVAWSAGAFADHYEVLRSATIAGPFSVIASPSALSYVDTDVLPNTTDLYQVRSVDNAANRSTPTPIDAATTIVFTDDPLSAGTTAIATHMSELRTAVNAMRAAAALNPFTFTDATLGATIPIKAVHVTELRSALDEARSAIGLSAIAYSEPIIAGVTTLKAIHLQEIRNAVK